MKKPSAKRLTRWQWLTCDRWRRITSRSVKASRNLFHTRIFSAQSCEMSLLAFSRNSSSVSSGSATAASCFILALQSTCGTAGRCRSGMRLARCCRLSSAASSSVHTSCNTSARGGRARGNSYLVNPAGDGHGDRQINSSPFLAVYIQCVWFGLVPIANAAIALGYSRTAWITTRVISAPSRRT